MSSGSIKRDARDRIVAELKRELVGPSAFDETLTEFPTSRYVVGRLAPQKSRVPELENDTLGVGDDDEEAGSEDAQPPLTVAFNPSSIGLSFLTDSSSSELCVDIEWGDYKREQVAGSLSHHWQRYQRTGRVEGLSVSSTGPLPQIKLSDKANNPEEVRVNGLNDDAITLEGVVREIDQYRAVSLFLVNRRTEGDLTDRSKDERWIYQPSLRVTSADTKPIFVAKELDTSAMGVEEEGETAINNLLYRNAREFATGHGVAANWLKPSGYGTHSASVSTEFIPSYEVPQLIPPSDQVEGAILDMQLLAEATDSATVVDMLEPLVATYEKWTDSLAQRLDSESLFDNRVMKKTGTENLNACLQCAKRLREGLDLISDDNAVFEAFRFANRAMWDQRIHSSWAAANQERGEIQGSVTQYNEPRNRTWRPFQIGFILANLTAVACEEHSDRSIVDLLWFPTGGGKTEAYLGLAAFVLATRRLRGDRDGMVAGAGVSIIMRYTLRLLTVQQFQRATALLCACEVIRRGRPDRWGEEPFQIGIWVGLNTAPNAFSDSRDALETIRQRKTPRTGSPVQLVSCPRCGTNLVDDRGTPLQDTYLPDERSMRTRVYCPNSLCEFAFGKHNEDGLPILVVDDEIYRFRPSLIVATVDKFARMPFKGETQSLFGFRDRYSPTRGHLTPAHGTKPDNKSIRDAVPAARLLPPELIIQDELHLISGPLGTMVGLYETAVDFLSRRNTSDGACIRPKIIASTATIRRASHQVRQLYSRDLFIFPPSGLEVSDSFFAKELPVNTEDDSTAGRLYIGVNAPGSSAKTLLVRVYSILLAAAQSEIDADPVAGDPYATLVGYFNSLRALGGARRLVDDDIKLRRLGYLNSQRQLPKRPILTDPEELTSRIDSRYIPRLLKRLDRRFPRKNTDWPVDVLLATNMISVGVDIDRLGLMVVTGQPKTTSEYIQATSRVGRKHPGLVVTMYNWLGARDLSHYERFQSYHAALYRQVEAISVTPYSSRALDRGLQGIFTAMHRLAGDVMPQESDAQNFAQGSEITQAITKDIVDRANALVGSDGSQFVVERLRHHSDEWTHLGKNLLRYSWLRSTRPPQNARVLLKTAGTDDEGEWPTPGSLREVEPTAAFFLDERSEDEDVS